MTFSLIVCCSFAASLFGSALSCCELTALLSQDIQTVVLKRNAKAALADRNREKIKLGNAHTASLDALYTVLLMSLRSLLFACSLLFAYSRAL